MTTATRKTRLKSVLFAVASAAILVGGTAVAQTTVKFGITGMTVSFATTLMGGAAPELYTKHGISIELTDFRGNTNNCVAAILSGAVEVCQVGSTSTSDAIVEGGDFRVIALTAGPLGEIIISTKAAAKLGGVTATSPLNDRIRALKGLRLTSAGPGTPHYLALDAAMRRVGMTIEDVRFRTLVDPVATMESIRNDQIDGSLFTVGTLAGVIKDNSGVRWINMAAGEVPEISPLPYVVVIATNTWIAKNGPTITKLRAGLSDSVTALNAEPAKYSALMKAKYFPQLDQTIWDESFKLLLPAFFKGATAPRAGWDYMLKLQASSSKKDYSKASYEKAVIPEAQMR